MIDIIITITSVGLQSLDAFIYTIGYGGPQWGQVELI